MRICVGILLGAFLFGCGVSEKSEVGELKLFVAASLMDVVNELVDSFKVENDVRVNLNLASSGMLARQINQGALCDVYLSANKKWMDYVNQRGMEVDSTRSEPCQNSLVLITQKSSGIKEKIKVCELPKLFSGDKISIGDPNHVPAGKYAVEALKSLHIYAQMEHSILPAKDVRSALMVVEMGECPLGIVYKTDALRSKKVSIYKELNDSTHSPIIYYASLIKSGENKEFGKAFLDYINKDVTKSIWSKYGFIVQ